MKENEQRKQLPIKLLFFFTLQRSTGAIIEYPLECIKTRWQANPEVSLKYTIFTSYKCHGIRSFYDEFIPHFAKKLPVQFVRWPMILKLPSYYQELLKGAQVSGYTLDLSSNLLAALTIASIETSLAAPFDTCSKLDLIINRQNNYTLGNYLKDNSQIKQQFRGVKALYMKEIFGWGSFLSSLNMSRKYSKKNDNNEMHFHQYLGISLLCGTANATAVTPWDVIRSHIQKHKNKEYSSLKPAIKEILAKNGASGFFVGWNIRMIQLTIATALSIPVIESYEKEQLSQNIYKG